MNKIEILGGQKKCQISLLIDEQITQKALDIPQQKSSDNEDQKGYLTRELDLLLKYGQALFQDFNQEEQSDEAIEEKFESKTQKVESNIS